MADRPIKINREGGVTIGYEVTSMSQSFELKDKDWSRYGGGTPHTYLTWKEASAVFFKAMKSGSCKVSITRLVIPERLWL